MDIKHLFDDSGDLIFDPYRSSRDDIRYQTLFCEDGYLRCDTDVVKSIQKLVKNNNWSPWCDAVGLIHSDNFADNTKGNYSTIYYFR